MEKTGRIAIVDSNKCKPNKCGLECKKRCPVVMMGKLYIEVSKTSKIAIISEELCTGCNQCVKKCPYKAIKIINVNILSKLHNELIHRYGKNGFALYRLPCPKIGTILGIIGSNGQGKSTALKILAGKLVPQTDLISHFRGNELQNYFTKMINGGIKVVNKPQHIDAITKTIYADKKVCEIVAEITELDMSHIMDKKIFNLSGGELQLFAIAYYSQLDANVYMFDEPSSYLDVRQRIKVARFIRNKMKEYTIVVEHDLALLDYISDQICVFYGHSGAYGITSYPYSSGEGINIFLDGYSPCDNYRFREEPLKFKIGESGDEEYVCHSRSQYNYPHMFKTYQGFELEIEAGDFSSAEIIVLMGENGVGKSTMIKILAGLIKDDDMSEIPQLGISYKPQIIVPKFEGTVLQLLQTRINVMLNNPQFMSDVIKPLQIEEMYDYSVNVLSGGEIARVALVMTLGKVADVYFIDEPSAFLDSEQRLIVAKIIKRFMMHTGKTAFIVEHDIMMATYLADRIIVFDGEKGKKCKASKPLPLVVGLNMFLKNLDITFRRDSDNYRPRINKLDSVKDREQKMTDKYYYVD